MSKDNPEAYASAGTVPTQNVNIVGSTITITATITNSNVNVTIIGQTGNLNVNLAASAVTLNVNISSQTSNINVNLAASSVTITITGSSVLVQNQGYTGSAWQNMAVDASGNMTVNIVAQTLTNLNVNIAAQTVGNINVNIAAQTGNININLAASAVTLNVSVQNATIAVTQSGTWNVNIQNATITITGAVTINSVNTQLNVTTSPNIIKNGNFATGNFSGWDQVQGATLDASNLPPNWNYTESCKLVMNAGVGSWIVQLLPAYYAPKLLLNFWAKSQNGLTNNLIVVFAFTDATVEDQYLTIPPSWALYNVTPATQKRLRYVQFVTDGGVITDTVWVTGITGVIADDNYVGNINITISAASLIMQVQNSPNIISNGFFGTGDLSGWLGSNNATVDTSTKLGNNNSCKLTGNNSYINQIVPHYFGNKLQISFYARAQTGGPNEIQVAIYYFDGTNDAINISPTTTFSPYSAVGTSTKRAYLITFWNLSASDTVWITGINCINVDDDTQGNIRTLNTAKGKTTLHYQNSVAGGVQNLHTVTSATSLYLIHGYLDAIAIGTLGGVSIAYLEHDTGGNGTFIPLVTLALSDGTVTIQSKTFSLVLNTPMPFAAGTVFRIRTDNANNQAYGGIIGFEE